jgi:hypothetical protein
MRATAGYDGMYRPRPYQEFVFVRGIFAGTLAPQPMNSRRRAPIRAFVRDEHRLTAEYDRYAAISGSTARRPGRRFGYV